MDIRYQALLIELVDGDSCELCFVGSSRVQEGISVVAAKETFVQQQIDAPKMTNLGIAAGGVDESLMVVRRLIERGDVKIVAYGLSVHPFMAPSSMPDHSPKLVRWTDLRETSVEECTAKACRSWAMMNELAIHLYIFRYRRRPYVLAKDILYAFGQGESLAPVALPHAVRNVPNSLRNEGGPEGSRWPGRSLETRPTTDDELKLYLKQQVGSGDLRLRDFRFDKLRAMAALCEQAGVMLILFEVPVATELAQALGRQRRVEFVKRVDDIANSHGAVFITLEEIAVSLEPSDFLEMSHLNEKGAGKFTASVVPRIAEHAWKRLRRRHKGSSRGAP